jgi:hypothetical protein
MPLLTDMISDTPSISLLSPSTRTAISVPEDILCRIIPLLELPDLITCLQVSTTVHHITAKILYPDLYSTVTIDISKSTPTSMRYSPGRSIWTNIQFPSRISFLPHPFTYIKFLTLTAHDRREYFTQQAFHMPLLETLRVNSGIQEQHLDLCYHHLYDIEGIYLSSYYTLDTCCPLVSHIRPKRLIIGGIATDLAGSFRGLWDPSTSLPSFITELTVLVGMFGGWEADGEAGRGLLRALPAELEKVSFVVSAGEPGWDLFQDGIKESLSVKHQYDADRTVRFKPYLSIAVEKDNRR